VTSPYDVQPIAAIAVIWPLRQSNCVAVVCLLWPRSDVVIKAILKK